jgi:glutamine amidotransferase
MAQGVVGVIDHGVGNYISIINLLDKIGVGSRSVRSVQDIDDMNPEIDKIIIPGVGSFDAGITALNRLGIFEGLKKFTSQGGGLLGICLGMQLMFESSEEGTERGLGFFPGELKRIKEDLNHRVPHVGWHFVDTDDEWLFANVNKKRFYHNHSFALRAPNDFQIASIQYSEEYVVAVRRGNIVGVQFHPEKSHSAGERIILNFLNYAPPSAKL